MPTVPRLAPWLALALLVLALAAGRDALRTSRDGLEGLLYNADYLSPAALYQDVVHDGYPLAGYRFSAATFAVPDQAVYFAARAASGSHAVALPVWVAALFLLLTAAGVWAGCELLPGHRRAVVTIGLGGAAAYLAANAAAGFVHPHNDLMLPVWHNGALTVTLAGLAAGLRLVRDGTPAATSGWAAAVAGLTAVGLFSDRFVGLYLIVPTAVALAASGGARRRLLVWLVATGGGGLIGLVALRWFQGAADPISNYWKTPDLARLTDRAVRLAWVVGGELEDWNPLLVGAMAWYVWATAAGVRWLVRPARPSAVGFVRRLSAVVLAVVTLVFLLSAAADDYLAPLEWVVFSRYFVGPIGVAYLGWGVWLAGTRRLWALAPAAAAAAVGWAATAPPVVDRPARLWYPDQVRAVDEACLARGLTLGLSGYADAKPCTLLGRAGVTVRPVRPDAAAAAGLVAFPWLGNDHWYARGPAGRPARFQFVLVGDRPDRDGALAEATVVGRLGEPAERVPVGDRVLLVYDRPSDWRLARFGVLGAGGYEGGKGALTVPGAALLAPAGAGVADTPDLVRVAAEGKTAVGLAAYGPYLPVGRLGRHRVTFRLTAAGDSGDPLGYVDVVWARADGTGAEVLAAAAVVPGDAQEVPLDVYLQPTHVGGRLEFRLHFAGRGRVELRAVHFERRSHRNE